MYNKLFHLHNKGLEVSNPLTFELAEGYPEFYSDQPLII